MTLFLAAAVLLLVWFVVHDAPITKAKLRTRIAKIDQKETSPPVSPDDASKLEAGHSVEFEPTFEPTPMPSNSTTSGPLVNVAKLQKTPAILNSHRVDALTSRFVSIVNIEPTFMKSPVYVLTNGKGKSFTPQTWLRVVVSFRLPGARITRLSFRYKITIADQMFTGTMSHPEIVGEGDHQVAAFVVPVAVASAIRGRDLAAENLVGVGIEVADGKTVLAQSQVGQATEKPRQVRPDLLRSVANTPFAPLEIDLYEKTTD